MKLLKIADLCESVNVGFVGPSTRERDVEGVPFLMGKNIGPGYLKLKSLDRVRRDFHLKNRKSQLKVGDIVVVRIGNSGQAVQIPEGFGEANCAGLVVIKTPNLLINPNYLVYYLNSPQGRAYSLSKATGTTRQTLNTKTVAETLVPVPSVEKQNEIVERLDNAFAEIDLLEKNQEIIIKKGNLLFKSFLSVSFKPALKNPNSFDSNLKQAGDARKSITLGEVMDFQNGRAFKSNEWTEEGLPIIRIQNLNNRNSFFNHFGGSYDERILVQNGDLLFSWSGTVGTSFGPHIWSGTPALLNQHIFKVKLQSNVDKQYAYYALQSITSEIEKSVNGSVGLTHITKAKLVNFEIPLPSLAEQKRIIEVLNSASFEMNLLNRLNAAKLASISFLRQALLSSAFNEVKKAA